MSRLILVRHAQASLFSDNYDQLSDLGHAQSQALGRYLVQSGIAFDKIYTGPLQRHRQTMEHVQTAFQRAGKEWNTPYEIHELKEHQGPETLRELMPQLLGRYPQIKQWAEEGEGKPELRKKTHLRIFHYFMEKWASGQVQDIQPPHLEDWLTFREEVRNGIKLIMEKSGKGETVIAFTSGGTIAATLGHGLNMTQEHKIIELNGSVKNTSLTEFLFTPQKFSLRAFNTVPHLKEDHMVTFV